MAKRMIVEDSDDEGDIESPAKGALQNDISGNNDDKAHLSPVKVSLNDVGERAQLRESWLSRGDAPKAVSLSQPNAPGTLTSNTKPRKKARTLPDVDAHESSTASLNPSKTSRSFDSSDIFEFQGEDGVSEEAPKKRRRTKSHSDDANSPKQSMTPHQDQALEVLNDATQTSTLPTIANTSPYPMPSLSEYPQQGEIKVTQNEHPLEPQHADASAPTIDSFEDELAAAYPPSMTRASTRPMVLVPEQNAADGKHEGDELEAHDDHTTMTKESRRTAEATTKGHDFGDELGSDDQEIGLPKDQYKPRPSRSRGRGRVRDEDLLVPTDFSRRPEAVAKSKKKLKHTKSVESNEKDTTKVEQEVVAEVTDMRKGSFEEPSLMGESAENEKAEKSLQHSVNQSQNAEAAGKPVKKQRGRPKKSNESVSRDADVRIDGPTDVQLIKDAAAPTQLKKQEGKKRKSASIVDEDSDTNDISETKPSFEIQVVGNEKVGQPLQEMDANSSPRKRGRPPKKQEEETPKPATPEKNTAVPSPKGPDKHSPINTTGAVKFRVGLSKRARIEPLLRIVRK